MLRTAALALPLIAAAAAVLLWVRRPITEGALSAAQRAQVDVGRAALVLERGAEVRWRGDEVTQVAGDVFYRVEPGAAFRVHTPAGDIAVLGTCFRVVIAGADEKDEGDVKKRDAVSAVVGVAVGAVVVVGVYEGKVRASQGATQLELGPGEAARLDGRGVHPAGSASALEAALVAPEQDPAFAEANKNLADSVRDLNRRLASVDSQKKQLEKQLATAQDELARAVKDGKAQPARHEYDLTEEDWAELAKDGTIKYRMPCFGGDKPWRPKPDKLAELGLSPDDADDIQDAYARSNKRLWGTIRPLCLETIGNADVVDKLGPNTCTHLILDVAMKEDSAATQAARKLVGEIRAGHKPAPGPNEPLHPVARLFLALTGETKSFQADLAQAFGPEEGHRLAYANGLCHGSSTFGGSPPKGPAE
jgi:hypothetical protein